MRVQRHMVKIGLKPIGTETVSPSGLIFETQAPEPPLGVFVGGTLFLFFSAVVCFVWMGIYLVNLNYIHEYTSLNRFNSARYNWDWWFVWLLTFNVLLPFSFGHALTNNGVGAWARVHRFFSFITVWCNLLSVIALTIQWLFFCNNGGSGLYSACNDYRWCGVFFSEAGGFCTNGMAFPSPYNVDYANLARNTDATAVWVYTFIFMVHGWAHLAINADFRKYGIFK